MTGKERDILFREIEDLKKDIGEIRTLLDTVSANGNKGLHNSLKDLYEQRLETQHLVLELREEVRDLKSYLRPVMDRHIWWVSTKKMINSTPFFGFVKTKWGRLSAIFISAVVINGIFGLVPWDALFAWIKKLLG